MWSRAVVVIATIALALALAPGTVTAAPADADCADTLRSNGTGWKPGSSAPSLPSTTPRPGPELLYRDPPRAPQLENTGVWHAAPIMVSGASAYRDGEFLYQDFLYDEAPLTYPAKPEVYAGNAADVVEVRVKPLGRELAVRLTYNTMLDPAVTATTLALGTSPQPRPMPHEAGASMPAELFVTVHGCSGDIVHAADGTPSSAIPGVRVDLKRRQVEVRIPYSEFDPRGRDAVRVGAAVGLWDTNANRFQRPDADMPAFFNVAFRYEEPLVKESVAGLVREGTIPNTRQNAALAAGDLSPFFASIDFTKLAARTDDDMPDKPRGVPRTGIFDRIYASHFETAQGRGNFSGNVLYPGYQPCHAPCTPPLAGRLQPYSVYVPERPEPTPGWGIAFFHHGTGENYNTFIERARRFADLDGGNTIAVGTESRGPDHWEFEQAGADLYEVWADLARHYRLDPTRATLSGQSLGGYATWKNAVQFPDLWSAVNPHIGPPTASGLYFGDPQPPQAGERTLIHPLLQSLRHVPVVYWVGQQDELVPWTGTHPMAQKLAELRYRHSYRAFAGDHVTTGLLLQNYDPQGDYLANRHVDRNPARVTHVFSKYLHQPEYGLTSDHAYWLSGIELRDDSGEAARGTIDAFSYGLGVGDAPAKELQPSAGFYPTSAAGAPVPYYGQDLEWGTPPATAQRDQLDITVRNVRTITVHAARAGLTCHPRITIDSDGPLEIVLAGCSRVVTSDE